MSTEDPFFDDSSLDRSFIKPTPGGRGRANNHQSSSIEEEERPRAQRASKSSRAPSLATQGASDNPLLNAATGLLSLISQLRETTSHPNVAELRRYVIQEIGVFEREARRQDVSPETVLTARYALCTLLDETVLVTPWGSESPWSKQSLLSTLHSETWGGEKFFQVLERTMQDPSQNLELLEFMYICLALGLSGKYRVLDRGRDQLDEIRDQLYRVIRRQRRDFERELSPHWRGVEDRRNVLIRYVPLWVVAVFSAAILLGTYIYFQINLNESTYPVYESLNKIARYKLETKQSKPIPPTLSLKKFLAPEVAQGLVEVQEDQSQTTVTIRGDDLFQSGQTEVNRKYHPLLGRIAEALDKVQGQVLVVGHTDNVPIRSLKFQSNWDLSRQRAVGVSKVLSAGLRSPDRLTPEGRADTEPLVANDTAANRSKNRRVEITLLAGVTNQLN